MRKSAVFSQQYFIFFFSHLFRNELQRMKKKENKQQAGTGSAFLANPEGIEKERNGRGTKKKLLTDFQRLIQDFFFYVTKWFICCCYGESGRLKSLPFMPHFYVATPIFVPNLY